MSEPPSLPVERCHPRLEIPAICLAMLFAPLAYPAVALPLGLTLGLVGDAVGWDGVGVLGDEDTILFFSVGGALLAYPLVWIVGLPIAIYFRSKKRLSLWTVLFTALALAWLCFVPCCLFLAGAATEEFASAVIAFAVGLGTVFPGTIAVAISFWAIYCFFTGQEFQGRWPWQRIER